MNLDMLGAKNFSRMVASRSQGTRPEPKPGARPVAPARQMSPSTVRRVADPETTTLEAELRQLGDKHRGHQDPKVAALARRALVAADSLVVQSRGQAPGTTPKTSIAQAAQVLRELKEALQKTESPKSSVKPGQGDASSRVAAAKDKLRVAAEKLKNSAAALKARASATRKPGPATAKVVSRAMRIASAAATAAQKFLGAQSKVAVVARGARQVRVGDDISDAEAQLQQAEQALDDAWGAAQAVNDDLAMARDAYESLSAEDPGLAQASNDFDAAMAAAMALIFRDTTLAVAAQARDAAAELVAALRGQGPPGSSGPPPPAPPPATPLGDLAISPDKVSLAAGQQARLSVLVSGRTATEPALWSSTNSAVAAVDQQGTVTAVSAGEVNISATLPGRRASARVVVTGQAKATVSPATLSLEVGKSASAPLQLLLNGRQAPTSLGQVSWTSSDSGIASVDAQGQVTASAPGIATLTASAGGFSATSRVTVTDPSAQVPPGGGGGGGWGGGGDGGYGGGEDGGYGGDFSEGFYEDENPFANAVEEDPFANADAVEQDPFASADVAEEGDPFADAIPGDADFEPTADVEDAVFDESVTSGDGLDMLGAVDFGSIARMFPGVLQAAGTMLSSNPSSQAGQKAQDEAARQELAAAKTRAAEAAVQAAKWRTAAWVVGGLGAAGLGGLVLRKVIS